MKRPSQPAKCADCGAKNPYLDYITWDDKGSRWACEHRYACEARQMLQAGTSATDAAAHAQQRRSW